MSTDTQGGLFTRSESAKSGPVECLGMTFKSDEERREYFLERLRERLRDPAFRGTPGFPEGSDEDILRMSDPPYYTACPNPFLAEYVRVYGKRYNREDEYKREPFAVDVSEGKYDWLYRAHAYHTKVPHLAIVPSILHYTRPGDLVLDGFCGSGMTGVAAQWCESPPSEYRRKVEAEWTTLGRRAPQWGGRRVILNDLGPALLDRMIAFFVQRGVAVPISGPEFLAGLAKRFPERDGMYFLPEQVAAYDRQRTKVSELKQLELFVTDEASAIQWVRQQLDAKPQKLQDLTPAFIREVQSWAKHEETVELRTILEQNFLRYDGTGPVPSQIHAYLSNAYREMRGLEKTDPALVDRARDRWYVPDPNKQGDLEKLREKVLLKEFEEYKTSKKKLKVFRTEALRAGFKAAYDRRDYETIVEVAKKIPEAVLQEDEKLLMYYDVASMRLGG